MTSPLDREVNTLDDADAHVRSLWVNVNQLAGRVRTLEKMIEVINTPAWKRGLFWLDGWPSDRIVVAPRWRPWHRWWHS